MSKHLSDLLAALIQLSYGQSVDGSSPAGDNRETLTHYKAALEALINKSYPPLIVRELLVLQGGPGRKVC